MKNFRNEFQMMLEGYKKNPSIFTDKINNIEEKLLALSEIAEKWNESGMNEKQYQTNVSRIWLPVWNGLAANIENISVSQTYDLCDINLVYYHELVEQVEEYLMYGKVSRSLHYEAC